MDELSERPPDNFYTFTWLVNSSKPKAIQSNKDVFLITGQNGLIAFIMIAFYLVTWLSKIGLSKNRFVRFFIFLHRTILKLFIVKMMMLTIAEVGSHNMRIKHASNF